MTHIFSQETGFVTSIITDLCVQINEYASASVIDAVQMYCGSLWLGTNPGKQKKREDFFQNPVPMCREPYWDLACKKYRDTKKSWILSAIIIA